MKCVVLTKYEERICEWVGRQRFEHARKNNLEAGQGTSKGNRNADNHIRGARGELAASIMLNVCWRPNIGQTKEPDIGRNIEVKTTDRPDGRLIVKPDDHAKDDAPYVLVFFRDVHFELVGWEYAGEAKKWPILDYGKDPCHYVDQGALRPISELKT